MIRSRRRSRNFSTSDLGSTMVMFFERFRANSLHLWQRNRSNQHPKSNLKKYGKVCCFYCTRDGPPLPASGTVWPSKRQGCLDSEALNSQKMVSRHVWGPLAYHVYRVFSHRGPRAIQGQFSMLVGQNHATQKTALQI